MTTQEIRKEIGKIYTALLRNGVYDISHFIDRETKIENDAEALAGPEKEIFIKEELDKLLQDMQSQLH